MENGKSCVNRVWGEVLPFAEPIGCVATLRSGPALISGWVFPSADLCGNYRSDFVAVGGSCLWYSSNSCQIRQNIKCVTYLFAKHLSQWLALQVVHRRPLWSLKSLQIVHRALLEIIVGYFLPAEEALAPFPPVTWKEMRTKGAFGIFHTLLSALTSSKSL